MPARRLSGLGDEGEGGENVGELGFGQAVVVGDEAVQLGTQLGAGSRGGDAGFVAAQADFLGQRVKLRRGANQLRPRFTIGPNAASAALRRGTGS